MMNREIKERLCNSFVDFPVIAAHEEEDRPTCEGLQVSKVNKFQYSTPWS